MHSKVLFFGLFSPLFALGGVVFRILLLISNLSDN